MPIKKELMAINVKLIAKLQKILNVVRLNVSTMSQEMDIERTRDRETER
jgi:hypothetical protein